MSTATLTGLVIEAHPGPREVAVVYVPAGAVVRVHHPDGRVREYAPRLYEVDNYGVFPGDKSEIGWGWDEGWYPEISGVRNGHRPMDRAAWHAAAAALRDGSVAYVLYELGTYYGKPQWTAVGYRVPALSLPVNGAHRLDRTGGGSR